LSNGADIAKTNNDSALQSSDKKVDEGWEEATINRVNVVSNKNAVTELLDMNALEERRREQDDVAEKMRLEETKAALEAARIGMENEGKRLKEEEERKKQGVVAPVVVSSGGDTKGKWVPVHLRGKPSAALGNSRLMMSKARGKSAMPNTGDEMDFPDLGSANAAIEAQKKAEKERKEKDRQRAAAKPFGIKTWGASRPAASVAPPVRKKLEIKPATKQMPPPAAPKVETSSTEPEPTKPEVKSTSDPAPAPVPTPAPAPAPAPTLKKKKKKKKDLSTFKSSS